MHVNYLAVSELDKVGNYSINDKFFPQPVHFVKAFLSLLTSPQKFTIAATTSGLALSPLPRVPGYCSSKFALRSFLLAVRRQLEYEGDANGVKIIEILPPAVQTELHDPKVRPFNSVHRYLSNSVHWYSTQHLFFSYFFLQVQPEFAGKPAFGVPLDEYAQDLYDRLVAGDQGNLSFVLFFSLPSINIWSLFQLCRWNRLWNKFNGIKLYWKTAKSCLWTYASKNVNNIRKCRLWIKFNRIKVENFLFTWIFVSLFGPNYYLVNLSQTFLQESRRNGNRAKASLLVTDSR